MKMERYHGMWVGVGLSWGWYEVWGCEGKGKGRRKTCFSADRAVYAHYFKDIHQGALQFDCVMFSAGARVGSWG